MKVIMPWNNLGELAFKWFETFYIGIFVSPYFGIFIRRGENRYWVNFRECSIHKGR